MEVISLTKDNFQDQIDVGLTFVEFFESECDACREQSAIAEELAEELRHIATVVKVNIRQEQEISNEYHVTSTPTIMLFKDGYQVETLVGLQSKDVSRQTVLRYAAMGDTC
ncbi:thioredoxin 1 [Paenibacillus taihuensis]|uniref:Thioredoxin n=1 Tax=Paenibacillus taihuensis TaxID=1156355 RepID=A0A3D9SDN1_9BACL|nr:thioredoxin domain-containing protein [Paenibacillus taihuensis]REE91712.1 thioredoxin 1 [Paenibacillus taihuensis]